MSLSKPFKLELLPRLALEHVLHQMYPIDLFFLVLCAPHLSDLTESMKLADYCDIECRSQNADITFQMKNGGKLRICIENESNRYRRKSFEYPDHYRSEFVEMSCDTDNFAMEMYKCNGADTVYFLAYVAGPLIEEKHGVFDLAYAVFPCRIRTFRLFWPADQWISDKVFHWYYIKKCENLHMLSIKKDWHVDILNGIEVSKELVLEFRDRYSYDEELIDLTNMTKYEGLSLLYIGKMTRQQLLDLNNEHLELESCELNEDDLRVYLRKWMRGELPKLKTMRGRFWEMTSFCSLADTLETVSFNPRDNENCLVKFSSELYIDTTPGFDPNEYRTMLLRNIRGDYGTLTTTFHSFHFVVWAHPLPPIEVPRGYQLIKTQNAPFHVIKPLTPKTFSTDEEARLDSEGLISFGSFFGEPFFTDSGE